MDTGHRAKAKARAKGQEGRTPGVGPGACCCCWPPSAQCAGAKAVRPACCTAVWVCVRGMADG
jgi:hypothetical protein